MDDVNMLELLTKAREYFREHGGAKRMFKDDEDDGRVCALGALREVIDLSLEGSLVSRAGSLAYVAGAEYLALHSRQLYGYSRVAVLNDLPHDTRPEILSVYDHAIKELENG